MWIVSKLVVTPRTYSFASSGQGTNEDLVLHADDQELVNMLRLVDWSEDPVQVVVCDACGTVGCATGNYVAVRRLADYVVFAPPTRPYEETADETEKVQYLEPWFIRKRGVPLVPVAEWDRLRNDGFPLPSSESMSPLRWSEAVIAAQIEAPHRMLGDPGQKPQQRLSEVVQATDPWLEAEVLDRLGDVAAWRAKGTIATLRKIISGQKGSLILKDPFQEVVLFGKDGDEFGLYFEPGMLLLPRH
ncbi:hypothetical protein [Anaeromyxobacter diazotrophicus]|uniref:Uncharacterized protein n=1 Tax=Anaeromyxobacter diazotrophicus TaxID=2590199 RepID=A0A7I9VIJ9_9BACT|nr:hypothetical protein [Anaeromyxobacter diazotrophicus]GEJ55958.1 hypothetical protein AMYX_06990 [Anaeromyxobacter diazotrophicus]